MHKINNNPLITRERSINFDLKRIIRHDHINKEEKLQLFKILQKYNKALHYPEKQVTV